MKSVSLGVKSPTVITLKILKLLLCIIWLDICAQAYYREHLYQTCSGGVSHRTKQEIQTFTCTPLPNAVQHRSERLMSDKGKRTEKRARQTSFLSFCIFTAWITCWYAFCLSGILVHTPFCTLHKTRERLYPPWKKYTYTHAHVHAHTYTHTSIYLSIYIYIYIYIHMYIYMYTHFSFQSILFAFLHLKHLFVY